jgi:hypothetical protein
MGRINFEYDDEVYTPPADVRDTNDDEPRSQLVVHNTDSV